MNNHQLRNNLSPILMYFEELEHRLNCKNNLSNSTCCNEMCPFSPNCNSINLNELYEIIQKDIIPELKKI